LFTEEGTSYFEKTIGDFILYKIEEKIETLDRKLRINYAKAKGDSSEKKKLEKEESKS
jgi:hypothetical protein